MKVVIVDHPKLLGFLLRMYYPIPKVKEEHQLCLYKLKTLLT